MAGIGLWAQKNMLDWSLRGASPTQPAAVFISLAMGPPSSISMSEIGAGSGYTRQTGGFGAAATPAGSGSISNSLAATFGPFSSSQAITGLCIVDNTTSAAPNMLWFGNLTTARTPLTGDSLVIAVGALQINLA